ncbi:MAG TPA: PilZ domain-containing protein [Thermodesulfobacteriota bacterium]|nr:PilZ domain-containing protein [Deltaproteobacteria bacterium]HNR12333.1 PilZ domain-containing protein [Thermodesulfobacteriota bacterium]HNU71282.1 PilZ domain-containing protein [Thermodesulfobacteriota bacterium]HQO77478.1 PilZ domain-containing protein [Thermodesulfobacteriota bacterium]
MAEERRKFPRVSFTVEAELLVHGTLHKTEALSNLSVGGCLLPLSEKLDPGTPCEVTIFMGGASSELKLHVIGEIVRNSSEGTAVQFTHIDPDSLMHLQNIVNYNTASPDKPTRKFQFRRGLF